MPFRCPDLDTLHLAITSGVVPPAIGLAPVQFAASDGVFWLAPTATMPRTLRPALARLGVAWHSPGDGPAFTHTLSCWLQALPVVKEASPPVVTGQTPVLFELPEAAQLPILAAEMLRLGNDRQGFRWVQPVAGDNAAVGALLRAIGPPYYTLLRAIDKLPTGPSTAPVRAYLERAKNVWVEVGYQHPLAEQIRPPEGQFLLIRAPRDWVFAVEGPYQDVYEFLEFQLPDGQVAWEQTDAVHKLTVPLRLAAGSGTDVPEFWVLKRDASRQLDELVGAADERLLNRLAFAVATQNGDEPTVVLRVRPGKHPGRQPPTLVLSAALACRSYLRLPNLFVPCGQRLRPPLRRDRVRQLLAPDLNVVTWLEPTRDGSFLPASLPEGAFRPLEDWVEYVLDRDRESLAAWVGASQFDFDSFECRDDLKPRSPKGPPGDGKRSPRSRRGVGNRDEADEPEVEIVPPSPSPKPEAPNLEEFAAPAVVEPTEAEQRLTALKQEFLELNGPMDDPARVALWPELARLHTVLEQRADAALCWQAALWSQPRLDEKTVAGWVRTEGRFPREGTADLLDAILNDAQPAPADVRAVAALAVWGQCQPRPPALVAERRAKILRFLEAHEKMIGVRAVWLAWTTLAKADVLALARVRDRLLNRLLTEGLSPERDLPLFLRFAGQRDSERLAIVRQKLAQLHKLAIAWCGTDEVNKRSLPYVDLTFSFGLARLGEVSEARDLLARAETALAAVKVEGKPDEVHAKLFKAYRYRIEQALAGKVATGALPVELIDEIQRMDGHLPFKINRYHVLRLREYSRVLEPHEKIAAFDSTHAGREDELGNELIGLAELADATLLESRLRGLMRDESRKPLDRLRILDAAMKLAPRLGERFTTEALNLILPTLDRVAAAGSLGPKQQDQYGTLWGSLLERGVHLSGHYDHVELMHRLVPSLVQLLGGQWSDLIVSGLDLVVGQCFRGLRQLGLRDELYKLLQRIEDLVLPQGDVTALVVRKPEKVGLSRLRILVHAAGGWMSMGMTDRAWPTLEHARRLLYEGPLHKQEPPELASEKKKLACTYALALGQAPVDLALGKIEELFKRLGPLANTFTTNKHFSLYHLKLIEDVVLSVVSDDFTIGPTARRWLDEDEYLVRRRIHGDLRQQMAQAGM